MKWDSIDFWVLAKGKKRQMLLLNTTTASWHCSSPFNVIIYVFRIELCNLHCFDQSIGIASGFLIAVNYFALCST